MSKILHRADASATGVVPHVHVDPDDAGWKYLRFSAYRMRPGDVLEQETGEYETGLVILGGACDIAAGEDRFAGVGKRKDVWEKVPPYAVLLPPGVAYAVTAKSDLHLAVAGAKASPDEAVPARLIAPDEIVAEERGEGQTFRYIQHILPPTAKAARLLLVEVYTPAGNWSSFPPHKHDTEDQPRESYLEETYYYGMNPKEGFAFQRVYTPDRSLDEAAAPQDGDLVAVPKGFHPVSAMPGYECYYLNAMAGPTRKWNFTVDADYEWLMNWKKPKVTEDGGS